MSRPPKIILGVVIARWARSSAGHTCSVMNWALGFRSLGWDVWLIENIAREKLSAPAHPGEPSPEELFFASTAREFGLDGQSTLLVDGESDDVESFRAFARGAELFLNYSGQFDRLDLLDPGTRKAYLDVDPAFTQLWSEVCGSDMNLAGHDCFVTVGANINSPHALLPRAGRSWIPTVPPVAARWWRECLGEVQDPSPAAPWTTIGHWYGYPEMEWQGRKYGGKRESFLQMLELPHRTTRPCAIATDMKSDWDDYRIFAEAGWLFHSAEAVCRDIPTYLQFIAASRGEIGIAKTGYVTSRGGWLSDRSMIYLALGRPVIQQDTGWTEVAPSKAGLLAFSDPLSAAAAIERIEGDYTAHSTAAVRLAEDTFGADRVIARLLDQVF